MAVMRRIGLALRMNLLFPLNQETCAGVQRFARERGRCKCEIAEPPLARLGTTRCIPADTAGRIRPSMIRCWSKKSRKGRYW